MEVHDITNASPDLLALVEKVRRGEDVTLMRNGKAVARVSGIPAETDIARQRGFGSMAGEIWMAPDFDDWPDDIAAAFEMREPK